MNRVTEYRQRLVPVTSSRELALRVGCSHAQIRLLEAGFSNPGIVMARKIAKALNATLDEVFPAAEPRKKGRAA